MVQFTAIIKQFGEKGEKTGWTYLEIPAVVAHTLIPNRKQSFRVKGKLDNFPYEGISLLPMGEGNFILALNASLRKGIKKRKGASVNVQMVVDLYEKPLSAELMECLSDEPKALEKFNSLPASHQKYFSAWIESARTDSTKTKRIAKAVIALSLGLGFQGMMKMGKN
ncbi:MAG TPA: YdeI/OmpD-associated family protein [Cytophagaceae bacterium]|jgi:hypothetical protein|nr:YdeI/OmpD-associated family protein [Cytophagaceae bacterium]